ncbi:GyrI-like domain-containing protein [Paenibacillus ginsengarvi]|nr:effector binding domain-containing protein [Paenibacillus ginsengarvi]
MSGSEKKLEVSVVELTELLLIGMAVTVPFRHGDYSQIGRCKEEFRRRQGDIPNVIDHEAYYSPWYSCEVMFTYMFCLRVSSLEHIPEGMIGFSIPARHYVHVDYDGVSPFDPDPYGALRLFREKRGLKADKEAMVVEKFPFAGEDREGRVTVGIYAPSSGGL